MPGSYSTDSMEKIVPRGIRNNNPLNIRVGNHWLGEVEHPTDKDFEQFVCIHYGLRAAFVLLRRYIERYGLDTIPDIISRWAPSSENNTSAYIEKVIRLSGIAADEKISFDGRAQMKRLVYAMAIVECGEAISETDIVMGYEFAKMF